MEQRLDETETGDATTITLVDAKRPAELSEKAADDVATYLGLDASAKGLVGWDVFDAVLTSGDLIHLMSWRDSAAAKTFEAKVKLPAESRLRHVRVIRDYGMFDRREAPQYYPDAVRQHA